jgi:hypothetical protein
MMAIPRQRGQILILLAAWLFFGGGASSAIVAYDRPVSEVKKAVKRVVTDAGRRGAILTDIDRWDSVQELQDETVSADRKELLKTLRRKDAQRSEVEAIIAQLEQKFTLMDWDFLNFRFGVKERVSKAEWAEIVAQQPND